MENSFKSLFITQCLNAFNDNIFKNSLILIVTYESLSAYGLETTEIISVASFLFTLPYLLFSALAGSLSDKFPKDKMAQYIKLIEIFIMALTIIALPTRNISFLLFLLFCMGMQSAFLGPVKYAALPELVKSKNLLKVNGIFQMGTFFSILAGTAVGGILVKLFSGQSHYIGIFMTVFSILGYISALKIPKLKAQNSQMTNNSNFIQNLQMAFQYPSIKYSIIFASWLWFIGNYYISTLPLLIKNYFFLDEGVSTIFMASFSVGIAIGSLLSNKISTSTSIAKCIFTGILGMSTAHIIACFFLELPVQANQSIEGISTFLKKPKAIALLISISVVSIFGGLYVVPLQTLVQMNAKKNECARMISALNIIQAVSLLLSSLMLFLLFRINLSIHQHYYILALLYILVSIFTFKHLKYFQKKTV